VRPRAAAAAAVALTCLGALAWSRLRDEPPRASPGTEAEATPRAAPETPAAGGDADPSAGPAPAAAEPPPGSAQGPPAPPPPDSTDSAEDVEALRRWALGRAEAGTKEALRELLLRWRSADLSRAAQRALDDAVVAAEGNPALDAAAGKLLLESPPPAQRAALSRLLANSGSDAAVEALLAAAARPELQAAAAAALATLAAPGAIPLLAAAVPGATPALLEAIEQAARNMETPKARELEAAARAARERADR